MINGELIKNFEFAMRAGGSVIRDQWEAQVSVLPNVPLATRSKLPTRPQALLGDA